MGRSWGVPGTAGSDVNLSDFLGQLVIILVGGYTPNVSTQYGDKGAVRIAMVVLTGDRAGEQIADVMVFNSRVAKQLKGAIGQTILCAVGLGEGKGSQQPLELVDIGTNPGAIQIADAWEQANPGRLDQLLNDAMAEQRAVEMREQAQQQQRNQPGQQRNSGQWGAQPPRTQNNGGGWAQSTLPGMNQAPPPQQGWAQQPTQNMAPVTPSWSAPAAAEEPPF